MNTLYVENPQTGRLIKKTTAKCKKLVKLGLITLPPEPKVEAVKEPEVQKVEPEPEPVSIKAELAKTTVNIVKENINSFRDLNKEDTDKLLRQLLIDKLCLKKPKKSKTKSKFKLKPPPPSSESESESDSN